MLFQYGFAAGAADGVEVAVEPVVAGGQAERPQRLHQPGEQLAVGVAADPVGVGAWVGYLRQCGEAEGEGQAGVVGQRPDVVDPRGAGAFGEQQRGG